jgi:hypothetical protein
MPQFIYQLVDVLASFQVVKAAHDATDLGPDFIRDYDDFADAQLRLHAGS